MHSGDMSVKSMIKIIVDLHDKTELLELVRLSSMLDAIHETRPVNAMTYLVGGWQKLEHISCHDS